MARNNGRGGGAATQERKEKPSWARKVFTGTGTVEVSVWPKTMSSDNGDFVVYNVSAKRVIKEDGDYKPVNGFRGEDVAPLIQLLTQASAYIMEEQNARE